jgi:hypothetical protein
VRHATKSWLGCKVVLIQLFRFLVVELIYSDSNSKFDMSIIFTTNYSFSERHVSVSSDALLMTHFMNLKIRPAQSLRCAHRNRVCVRVFIGVSARTCISIYVCTMFLKKIIAQLTPPNKFKSLQCVPY